MPSVNQALQSPFQLTPLTVAVPQRGNPSALAVVGWESGQTPDSAFAVPFALVPAASVEIEEPETSPFAGALIPILPVIVRELLRTREK